MKKYILMAAIALAAVSCNKPDPDPVKKASLSAEPRALEFAAASAPSQTIKVTAEETEWEHSLSDNSGWFTVNREGDDLTVSVQDNETENVRTASVTIAAKVSGVEPVKVTVKQAGKEKPIAEKPSLSATPQTLTFAGENAPEQEVTVTVTGDITWRAYAAGNEDWIHITASGDKFSVKLDDNPKSLQRSASINVSPSDKTISVVRVQVIQEPRQVEPSIVPILPGGVTPEEGLVLSYAPNMVNFSLTVEPEDAEWSVVAEGENIEWLTLVKPVVSPGAHSIYIEYALNDTNEARTATLVITHSDPACEPVRVTVTQKAKPDMNSTILKDVHSESFTQYRVEARGNNDFQTWPYSHWTFTLYTEGITYQQTWARWSGSGERIRLLLTASPQQEDNMVVEEGTYQVVSYDEYNVLPLSERKPGWVSGCQGDGTSFYPSGSWYQVMEDGRIVDVANTVSGSVTISKEGDDYTVSWDFVSDAGFKVTGSYTGPLNLQQ